MEKSWEEPAIDGLMFDRVARSGDVAVAATQLMKSYGSKILFRDLDLYVRRGERLATVGPNGSGKTTLLHVIQGITSPDAGSIRFGANVKAASVAQNSSGLDLNMSPLDVCGADTAARTLLACLKLRPDRLSRPLHEVSGGERTKVPLALFTLVQLQIQTELMTLDGAGTRTERSPSTLQVGFIQTPGIEHLFQARYRSVMQVAAAIPGAFE